MSRERQKYVRDVKKTCMTLTTSNWDKLSELSERNKMSRSDFVNALIENCNKDIRVTRQVSIRLETPEKQSFI